MVTPVAKINTGARYRQRVSRQGRWTGLSQADRQAERRRLLVDAAFQLFGEAGETAVTVRSVCSLASLNTRYFYESFSDIDELLGAVYDVVVADMISTLAESMADLPDDRSRLRAGIRSVLNFSSDDPRRGRVLFTEARTNPVLAARRAATQELLRRSVVDDGQGASQVVRTANLVSAAMYSGAMAELAQQWLLGSLGADLDAVVDAAVRVIMPPG